MLTFKISSFEVFICGISIGTAKVTEGKTVRPGSGTEVRVGMNFQAESDQKPVLTSGLKWIVIKERKISIFGIGCF